MNLPKSSHNKVCVDQSSSEDEYLGKEVQDDTVLLPGKTDHTPCTGPDHMNDYVQRVDVQGMQTDRGQNSESAEIFQISHKYYLKDKDLKPSSGFVSGVQDLIWFLSFRTLFGK
ncbi:MAG: hypothetical protein CMI25_02840 [Opitutae bacterium]|nr:hypothetical protein [Opitutae bacterium]